jgi:hypothetical protein
MQLQDLNFETLDELFDYIPGVSINQKNWEWYLNGEKWSGNLIDVKS